MMSGLKVLLTGASGYIGGSVLSNLLESDKISNSSISIIVRGEDKAKVFEALGVNTITFNSLDEIELLQRVAQEHDVIINTASSFHTASVRALILGLGDRKNRTGHAVHYIHTSGTSNMGDNPITGKYYEERIFSDKENIYDYLKSREALQVYPQRTSDIVTIETGLEVGVETHIIMPPTIYGIGTGRFNKLSIQVPNLIRAALKAGQAFVIGEGKGVWDYVHISDLAKLYELLLLKIITGEDLPSGERGIIFSGTGRYQWIEISNSIADALFKLGAIKTKEIRALDLSTAAEMMVGGNEQIAELGFASNSRTQADISHELGWKPQKTEEDFKNHFLEESKLIIA